jgi:uncharacterized protein
VFELAGALSIDHLAILIMAALFIGMAKTGVYGLGVLVPPILASVFVWQTISLQTISLNLTLWPVILLGGFLGVRLVRIIPEKPFRWLIIIMTSLASIRLFF